MDKETFNKFESELHPSKRMGQDLHPSKTDGGGRFYDKGKYFGKKHEDLSEPKLKGLDGRYYTDKSELEEANKRFMGQLNPQK